MTQLKLEMKEETLKLILQKYYTSRNTQYVMIESGINRKSEQINNESRG